MTGNPELRRNLWLEFTGNRVLIGAVLLPVVFATAAVADYSLSRLSRGLDFTITAYVAHIAFIVIVYFWGGRQAAGAVIGEIRERTWDSQRMSAVGPWTMTVGKLFGATAYTWTLGLACLLVHLAAEAWRGALAAALVTALTAIGYALACHTAGLLLSLTRRSRIPGYRPPNVTLIQLLALLGTVGLYYLAVMVQIPGSERLVPGLSSNVNWFGLAIDPRHFVALTGWLFAAWGVVGIYRRMREELQFRNAPLVWPLFLGFAVAYMVGLALAIQTRIETAVPTLSLPGLSLSVAFATLALFVYLLIMFETKDPQQARRIGGLLRAGRPGEAIIDMPLWPVSLLALVAGSAVIAGLLLSGLVRPGPVEGVAGNTFFLRLVLAGFLFVLRDVMIVLAFNLSRENRDGTVVAFILLLVLYGPMPLILLVGQLPGGVPLFWPKGDVSWAMAIGPVAVTAAILAMVVAVRWRAYWRSSQPAQTA